MRKILTVLALFFAFTAVSQEAPKDTDWALLAQENGVEIFGKIDKCPMKGKMPLSYAFLRVVNSTESEKNVQFSFGLKYDQGCSGCSENGEFTSSVSVAGNSSLEGACIEPNGRLIRLVWNPNLPSSWQFESIELNNVTVK